MTLDHADLGYEILDSIAGNSLSNQRLNGYNMFAGTLQKPRCDRSSTETLQRDNSVTDSVILGPLLSHETPCPKCCLYHASSTALLFQFSGSQLGSHNRLKVSYRIPDSQKSGSFSAGIEEGSPSRLNCLASEAIQLQEIAETSPVQEGPESTLNPADMSDGLLPLLARENAARQALDGHDEFSPGIESFTAKTSANDTLQVNHKRFGFHGSHTVPCTLPPNQSLYILDCFPALAQSCLKQVTTKNSLNSFRNRRLGEISANGPLKGVGDKKPLGLENPRLR